MKLGPCQDKSITFQKGNLKQLVELVNGVQFHSIILFNFRKLKESNQINGCKSGGHTPGRENYKSIIKKRAIN